MSVSVKSEFMPWGETSLVLHDNDMMICEVRYCDESGLTRIEFADGTLVFRDAIGSTWVEGVQCQTTEVECQ
jgi:hypothetical protein